MCYACLNGSKLSPVSVHDQSLPPCTRLKGLQRPREYARVALSRTSVGWSTAPRYLRTLLDVDHRLRNDIVLGLFSYHDGISLPGHTLLVPIVAHTVAQHHT